MTEEEIVAHLQRGGDPRRLIVAHSGGVMASNGRAKRVKRSGSAARTKRRAKDPLIDDLAEFVRRYVVITPDQLTIVALWIVHTYCIEAFEQTPYLAVTSPEKQCGKTRLLETLDVLVLRSWTTILPSEAVLYRNIDKNRPTLLLDEVDTIFNPKTADRYEAHRAILNAGHRRGNRVPRCVGSSLEVVEFEAFCPKVLSGIGTIPDTIADRSIPIRLERRRRDETVERFLRRDVEPVGELLRERAAAWADRNTDFLRDARPSMPDELNDRMQEGCEGLVAIADALGYGEGARGALVEVFSVERVDAHESMRLRLLADIRTVFEGRDHPSGITTNRLLSELYAIEDAPWSNYYGRSLEARDLAALLGHYGVSPTTIRTKGGEVKKGYKRDPLYEAWTRYLS